MIIVVLLIAGDFRAGRLRKLLHHQFLDIKAFFSFRIPLSPVSSRSPAINTSDTLALTRQARITISRAIEELYRAFDELMQSLCSLN